MCLIDKEKQGITPVFRKVKISPTFLQESENKNLDDVLSIMTYHTKWVLFEFAEAWERLQRNKTFKLLLSTTQPAHLVTILAVSALAFLFYPNKNIEENAPSVLTSFCYLASYGTHLGSQIWMTFVSGLSLYFSLPRHTFGSVQKVLFPKYFLINSILSFITVITFLKTNRFDLKDNYLKIQGLTLTLCFLTELLIRLYFTPPLISLISEKHTMEAANGVGLEVGKHDPGDLVNCPHYLKIHKRFRKVHMTIAMGNMLTMACSMIHLHYLAHKIAI